MDSTVLREDPTGRTHAAVEERLTEHRHVADGRAAARTTRRNRGEGDLPCEGQQTLGFHANEAPRLFVGDGHVAVGHAERSEDPIVHEVAQRPAADPPDDLAQHVVVDRVVDHHFARRPLQWPFVRLLEESVDKRVQHRISRRLRCRRGEQPLELVGALDRALDS